MEHWHCRRLVGLKRSRATQSISRRHCWWLAQIGSLEYYKVEGMVGTEICDHTIEREIKWFPLTIEGFSTGRLTSGREWRVFYDSFARDSMETDPLIVAEELPPHKPLMRHIPLRAKGDSSWTRCLNGGVKSICDAFFEAAGTFRVIEMQFVDEPGRSVWAAKEVPNAGQHPIVEQRNKRVAREVFIPVEHRFHFRLQSTRVCAGQRAVLGRQDWVNCRSGGRRVVGR
jgi:hypothetical protein